MSAALMKVYTLLVCLLLSGCGSLAVDRMFSDNLLNTAPKNDAEVLYPDWRRASQLSSRDVSPTAVETTVTKTAERQPLHADEPQSLLDFLASYRIDYELQAGEHSMVKLNRPILFQTGKAQLSADSIRWISALGRFLAQDQTIDIVVEGHTDNTGSERFNDGLSMRRAEAVKQVLLAQKIAQEVVYIRGYGAHLPSCSNGTAQGRACNRRATLRLIVPQYLDQ
ncbi:MULTISPECIES: OmpA family protein [Vibrio]|uniref:OmpA family protein n=1 Tax=Vibrio TaxID=662 RepID=UPI001FE89266|nr:OmpA family protein [Vibrio fujianensis]